MSKTIGRGAIVASHETHVTTRLSECARSMGARQSGAENLPDVDVDAAVDDEADAPYQYTSFSVVRPLPQAAVASSPPKKKSDIVVVAKDPRRLPTKWLGPDAVLQRLDDIPTFFPIVRSSLNVARTRDLEKFEKLDPKHWLLLGLRYQRHVRECADAVAFDQKALARRLKDVDMISVAVHHEVATRRQQIVQFVERLQLTVDLIQRSVERAEASVRYCVPLMRRLNNVLPEDDRLEHFTLVSEDD